MRLSNPKNMAGVPLLTSVVTSGAISGDGTISNPLSLNAEDITQTIIRQSPPTASTTGVSGTRCIILNSSTGYDDGRIFTCLGGTTNNYEWVEEALLDNKELEYPIWFYFWWWWRWFRFDEEEINLTYTEPANVGNTTYNLTQVWFNLNGTLRRGFTMKENVEKDSTITPEIGELIWIPLTYDEKEDVKYSSFYREYTDSCIEYFGTSLETYYSRSDVHYQPHIHVCSNNADPEHLHVHQHNLALADWLQSVDPNGTYSGSGEYFSYIENWDICSRQKRSIENGTFEYTGSVDNWESSYAQVDEYSSYGDFYLVKYNGVVSPNLNPTLGRVWGGDGSFCDFVGPYDSSNEKSFVHFDINEIKYNWRRLRLLAFFSYVKTENNINIYKFEWDIKSEDYFLTVSHPTESNSNIYYVGLDYIRYYHWSEWWWRWWTRFFYLKIKEWMNHLYYAKANEMLTFDKPDNAIGIEIRHYAHSYSSPYIYRSWQWSTPRYNLLNSNGFIYARNAHSASSSIWNDSKYVQLYLFDFEPYESEITYRWKLPGNRYSLIKRVDLRGHCVDNEDQSSGGSIGGRYVIENTSSTSITVDIAANTDYQYGTLSSLTIDSVVSSGYESTITFVSGSTPCVLSIPETVNRELCEDPVAYKKFIMTIKNGIVTGKNITNNGEISITNPFIVNMVQGQTLSDIQLPISASNHETITYGNIQNVPVGISISATGVISGTYNDTENITTTLIASAKLCSSVNLSIQFVIESSSISSSSFSSQQISSSSSSQAQSSSSQSQQSSSSSLSSQQQSSSSSSQQQSSSNSQESFGSNIELTGISNDNLNGLWTEVI